MTEHRLRIVTPAQLKHGFDVMWPSGKIEKFFYVVVRTLPDGNYEVKEPEIFGSGHFVNNALKQLDTVPH